MKNAAGMLLACVIGAGFVHYHGQAHFDPHVAWDGFTLPGFDAYVYVAMAEDPRVFTVAPWGYRILLPGLIGSLLPPRLIVPGFEGVAGLSLVAASGLLFVYLRLRGATLRATLLAVAAVMATAPVGAVFTNPFLVEPFALALLLVALIAIEGGASGFVVALTLALLSLSKEVWVLLLPVIFLREAPEGARTAAKRTLGMAAPALLIGALLRLMWMPQAAPRPPGDPVGALGIIGSSVASFAPPYLLGGLSILALLALARPEARDYALRHLFTLAALFGLPLAAAAYTGGGAATSFFTADVDRLLIYVLPFVAALAVHLDPGHASEPAELPSWPAGRRAAIALTAALMLAPLGLDRYSRLDLSVSRDGPYVLGFVRQTLQTARRLDRGRTVLFDPAERKFAWGGSPPNELGQLRFFLRDGFGPLAHYGLQDITMRQGSATLVLPVLDTRPLTLSLTMDALESAWVIVFAEGQRVGEVLVGPQAVQATFEIPATLLRRGDNPIELRCEKASTARPRLLRLELSQAFPAVGARLAWGAHATLRSRPRGRAGAARH